MQSYARKHIAEASYHIMLSCLADTYYRMGKKDSAICYEKKSVEASVALRDSFYLLSLVYYGKALELSLSRNEKSSSDMEELTALYINLAVLCVDMKRNIEVRNYLGKAVETLCSANNEIFLAQAYSNIGCIYQREGMDGEAGLYLKRALA